MKAKYERSKASFIEMKGSVLYKRKVINMVQTLIKRRLRAIDCRSYKLKSRIQKGERKLRRSLRNKVAETTNGKEKIRIW